MPGATAHLLIRPIDDGDTAAVEAVFAGLSLTSAYQRFGTGMTRLPTRMSRALAAVVPGRQRVFVAELDGTPVGLARWVRQHEGHGHHGPERGDEVEVALEVGDAWQGHGVGSRLLAAVARDARSEGFGTLLAYVVPGNARVVGWLMRLGAQPPAGFDLPYRLPVATVLAPVPATVLAPDGGGVSGACGCMAACRCASSARCGSGTGPTPPSPRGASVREPSSRCWSPAAVDQSLRTSSSTSCGTRPRPRSRPPPCTPWWRGCAASSARLWCARPTPGTSCRPTSRWTPSGSPPSPPGVRTRTTRTRGWPGAGRRWTCGPGGRRTPGFAATW